MDNHDLAQPIVVAPSTHLETVAAAAIAASLRLTSANLAEPPWATWLAGAFTKTVRRATRAPQIRHVVDLAATSPATTVTVGQATAWAFNPTRYEDFPKPLRNLQVSGLDLRAHTGVQDTTPPKAFGPAAHSPVHPLVIINRSVDMSTGKASAQVAHAVMAWVLQQRPDTRTVWAHAPMIELAVGDLAAIPEAEAVRIIDAGLTEITPNTETVRAATARES